jgi:hypothetical protein
VGTHDLKPQEIVDFCNYARSEYYLRPAYILVKLRTILRHPAELKRTIKAFLTFYKYLFNRNNKKNKEKFEKKINLIKENPHLHDIETVSAQNEKETKKTISI